MSIKIGVIADDFTGACDTGVQYAKKGLETVVLTEGKNIKRMSKKAAIIVIDTESRFETPETAYGKVREAAKILKEVRVNAVYKKIDSTFRGNIGFEIDAIMDEWDIDFVVLTPAFPANGRILVGGYLLVHQVPLGSTEVSHDPVTPIKESHIPTLLRSQTKREVIHIPLAVVMNELLLKKECKRIKATKKGIIVVDAVTQQDLERIADSTITVGLEKVTCGSAGFSEMLPEAFGLISAKPVIIISGSSSEVTLRQIRRLEETINEQATILDTQKLFKGSKDFDCEIQRIVQAIKTRISKGKDVIVTSANSKEDVESSLQLGRELGLSKTEINDKIVSALGEIAVKIGKDEITGMILTGGATTIALLQMMKISGVKVLDEVMPGIPISQIIGSKFDGLKIITKAGAFGEEDALSQSVKYLKKST